LTAGDLELAGHLAIPDRATGAVIFALGSGSSRRSPCNRLVATALNQAGLGTLLADLLTPEEELRRASVFDVRLLAAQLTGTAGALWAAAADPRVPIAAVVSRGGRPDLAGPQLASVRAPTLLIVGGSDEAVLDLNRQARQQLTCENELAVIPGVIRLFEEPGALEQVAERASGWFTSHLVAQAAGTVPAG
jgi:putative phosphoribosyl transferase